MRHVRFRRWTRAAGLLIAIAAAGCAAPMIAFHSARNLDGSDTAGTADNIWRVFSDGSGLIALTTNSLKNSSSESPSWSKDGSKIVYSSQLKPDGTPGAINNIWWLSPRVPNHPTALTTATAVGADSGSPQWSPDGTRVTFNSGRKPDGSDAPNTVTNVWVVNADGTGLKALTTATADSSGGFSPQWSPDGTKIAFHSSRLLNGTDAAGATSNIWVVNADGTGLTALTNATAKGSDSHNPQWSPDGKKIVFASSRRTDGGDFAGTTSNIWVANADGTGLTALTKATADQAQSNFPQWSPDGTRIAFESQRKPDGSDAAVPTFNVWVMNADGTGLKALTTATATEELFLRTQWFTDGSKIVFNSRRALDGSDSVNTLATLNVGTVNPDGTGLTAITRSTANETSNFFPQVH